MMKIKHFIDAVQPTPSKKKASKKKKEEEE